PEATEGIAERTEISFQTMEGEWVSNSTPDRCTGKTNLQIVRRMKTNFLQIKKCTRREFVARYLVAQKFCPHVSLDVHDSTQHQRTIAREPLHIHGICIVTQHERATLARSEPDALFAKGERELAHLDAGIHVDRIKTIDAGNGPGRRSHRIWWSRIGI